MSNTSSIIDLTRDLGDFLGLPADLDLPRLANVTISRNDDAPAWDVKAQLRAGNDEEMWSALTAWAAILGGAPTRGKVWPSLTNPSGWTWEGRVIVSVAETTIEIWGALDAEFDLPDAVHVVGESALMFLGTSA